MTTTADLKQAQQLFTSALDNDCPPERLDAFLAAVGGSADFPADERLRVYRSNYTGALLNALQLIYPVCRMILDEQCFRALAREFIWSTTSRCGDLNVYGEQWPGFLATKVQTHAALADYAYLPDLGALEWHWHGVYYQSDDPAFDFDGFSGFCANASEQRVGGIRFQLSHGLALLTTPYPVFDIWTQHKASGRCDQVQGISEPQYLVIYRDHFQPRIMPVERALYRLLDACGQGLSLSELSALTPEGETPLSAGLPDLIGKGWITGWVGPQDAEWSSYSESGPGDS